MPDPEGRPDRREDRPVIAVQRWGSIVAALVGTAIMLAIGVRYATGLFGLLGHEPLGFGEVWLGIVVAFVCFLGASALGSVALGHVGEGLFQGIRIPFVGGGKDNG